MGIFILLRKIIKLLLSDGLKRGVYQRGGLLVDVPLDVLEVLTNALTDLPVVVKFPPHIRGGANEGLVNR